MEKLQLFLRKIRNKCVQQHRVPTLFIVFIGIVLCVFLIILIHFLWPAPPQVIPVGRIEALKRDLTAPEREVLLTEVQEQEKEIRLKELMESLTAPVK